jgi:hypothetical protein
MTAHSLLIGLLLAISLTLAGVPQTAAETVTFQDGRQNALTGDYEGTSDTTLLNGSNTARASNYGAFMNFVVAGGKSRRALLRFDLSSLTVKNAGKDVSIKRVTLQLTMTSAAGSGTVSVYRIAEGNGAWVEGRGGAKGELGPANEGEATWNQLAHGASGASTPWVGGPGLADATSAYLMPAVATFAFDDKTPANHELSLALPVDLVAQWIAGNNAGLLLRLDDEQTDSLIQFHSSEAPIRGGVNRRPRLIVELTREQ